MGRTIKQAYNVAAYQYDNQLPEDFEQDEEVPEDEEIPEVTEDVSELSFYNHLELLLIGLRARYKSTWEVYLDCYNSRFPRLNNGLSDWREGKLFAYRKSISRIIKIMKIYKENYGSN